MAQEIVAWCDVCRSEAGSDVRGRTIPISINGDQPRGIDLCHIHEDKILGPLVELLEKYGVHEDASGDLQAVPYEQRPRKRTEDTKHPFQCFFCTVAYATAMSLGKHFETSHGLVGIPRNQQGIYGSTCPVCEERTGSLGDHVARRHQMTVMEAFRRALAGGNRNHVVAGHLEWLQAHRAGAAA